MRRFRITNQTTGAERDVYIDRGYEIGLDALGRKCRTAYHSAPLKSDHVLRGGAVITSGNKYQLLNADGQVSK